MLYIYDLFFVCFVILGFLWWLRPEAYIVLHVVAFDDYKGVEEFGKSY